MQIKQLQASLEKRERRLVERMQEENYLKQIEINTINQKLLTTIQQNYENNLKEFTKLQDDVKRINKEREEEQKRSTVKKGLNL